MSTAINEKQIRWVLVGGMTHDCLRRYLERAGHNIGEEACAEMRREYLAKYPEMAQHLTETEK
jgi:hypothetical protein